MRFRLRLVLVTSHRNP